MSLARIVQSGRPSGIKVETAVKHSVVNLNHKGAQVILTELLALMCYLILSSFTKIHIIKATLATSMCRKILTKTHLREDAC